MKNKTIADVFLWALKTYGLLMVGTFLGFAFPSIFIGMRLLMAGTAYFFAIKTTRKFFKGSKEQKKDKEPKQPKKQYANKIHEQFDYMPTKPQLKNKDKTYKKNSSVLNNGTYKKSKVEDNTIISTVGKSKKKGKVAANVIMDNKLKAELDKAKENEKQEQLKAQKEKDIKEQQRQQRAKKEKDGGIKNML